MEIPEDFAAAMQAEEKATATYNGLPFTTQKEYVTWITSSKREGIRKDRIRKAIPSLAEGRCLKLAGMMA